ncbi:phosphatase PAP2 family protein [Kribbella karoonensis]|uniref:phosphatase PAP2 family protein n=1 Tax=Kribbella karoonensis TaxID=324851 RepID=UPI002F755CF3
MVAEGEAPTWSLPRRGWQIVRELAVIAIAITLYFGVRGLITTRIGTAYHNAVRVIDLEKSADIFVEPRLQRAVISHGWLAEALGSVYIYGHWPVLIATLLWLLIRHRDTYPKFRNAMLLSGAVGLVIFAVFPVAPPRFLTAYGFVDTVTDRIPAYRVLQPPGFTNQYAAVPSLHFGWNLLMGIAVASVGTHWILRVFGWVMPILMFAAIVLTANHYILDGVLGGVLALLGLLAAFRLSRRRPAVRGHPSGQRSSRVESPW